MDDILIRIALSAGIVASVLIAGVAIQTVIGMIVKRTKRND